MRETGSSLSPADPEGQCPSPEPSLPQLDRPGPCSIPWGLVSHLHPLAVLWDPAPGFVDRQGLISWEHFKAQGRVVKAARCRGTGYQALCGLGRLTRRLFSV